MHPLMMFVLYPDDVAATAADVAATADACTLSGLGHCVLEL